MLNKKHNLKSGKRQKDKKKGFERKDKTGNQRKREKILEKMNLQLNVLMVFLSWNKSKAETKGKKETKKNQKKAKKKDRKEEKKKQERDRETEIEKGGGQERLRKNKGRDSKMNRKCPFLGEKSVLCIKSKEKKGNKQPPQ